MEWQLKTFECLSTQDLYQLLQIRVDVFVVEQNCPYPELDGKDILADTLHLYATNSAGKIVAYARLLAPSVSYPQASIGRVLVASEARGAGLANQLMQRAISATLQQWPEQGIQIGAQQYLVEYYQSHGFMINSDMYLEDGIPHLDMLLN